MNGRQWAVAAAVAWGWGCGRGELPKQIPVQSRVALEGFASCAALEDYIENTATLQMRAALELQRQRPRTFGWNYEPDAPMEASTGAAGPSSYTTTNTQVAGVDEADFVKNDGTRIFVLSGRTLYVNKSWPASELETVGNLAIEGWPTEMFLHGEHQVVVFSQVHDAALAPVGSPSTGELATDSVGAYGSNAVKVTLVDVSEMTSPKVRHQYYLPGWYASSRRIGASVRLVLGGNVRWPDGVRFYPEYTSELDENPMLRAQVIDRLIDENEKKIRRAQLAHWLPAIRHVREDGSSAELGVDCGEFRRSTAPSELGLLTVATLNLEDPASLRRTTVVAHPSHVYASQSALYVASAHWWWWPSSGQWDHTYVHMFDLTDPYQARYVASGGVEGHILNQFSLDEHQGALRLAVTKNVWTSRDGRRVASETINRVSVMAERDGALQVVGNTEDLAPGERIFSARFIGPRGYVVTFRQVDPLYTIDLSNPEAPKKVGELKIPGFSSYIHPIDDRYLLTIGEHRDDSGTWNSRQLKLSVFDVSDFAHPREAATQVIGTSSAYSEAAHNHKAFNYFPEKKLLAIPFSDWTYTGASSYWSGFVSELRVFHVDPDGAGITPKGALSMSDLYQAQGSSAWTWYWTPSVRRSVMADEYVYAITDAGVRVAKLPDLEVPLKTVQFPRAQ